MKDITWELVEAIFQTTRSIKICMGKSLTTGRLSPLQLYTLRFIKKKQEVSMSQIARYLTIELPSATSLINKLVAEKLVKRYEGKDDRRTVKLRLTLGGRLALENALTDSKKRLRQSLSPLTEADKNNLLSILKSVQNV
ncbi:MarR family transcriptional regulator [Candidatus Shapirobacteria bacterium]|nr:MarR family transcriptional regulator [Candidatus Shapirobacteria bacterium]